MNSMVIDPQTLLPIPNSNIERDATGRWVAGHSGYPGARSTKYARQKITARFLKDLADDYEVGGKMAIEMARLSDPVNYLKVIAGLLPKEVEVSGPLDGMSDDELLLFIDRLRSVVVAQQTGSGVDTPTELSAP